MLTFAIRMEDFSVLTHTALGIHTLGIPNLSFVDGVQTLTLPVLSTDTRGGAKRRNKGLRGEMVSFSFA